MSNLTEKSVHWIGAHPASWEITRIGSLYHTRNTKVSDTDYAPLSVTNRGVFPQLATVAKTDAHDARKLVKKGDFVINSRSDRRNACGVASNDGSVSLINIVLIPKQELHIGYYNWLFRTSQFADEFYKWGHGIVDDLWTTGWQDMKKIPILLPPYHEQQAIASFLDEKCLEIEALMEDIRAEISTLEEYKKSVITEAVTKECSPNEKRKEGKEENPKCSCLSWKIQKLKYIAELNPKQYNQITVRDMVTFTPMENIKNGYYINKEKPYSLFIGNNQYSAYEEGDIVFAKVTPCFENGNIAIMEGLINKRGFGSSELFVIRPNKIEQKFLFYVLQNANFLNYGVSSMTGTGGLKRVSSYAVNNYTLALPETKEQKNIVSFLDKKCADINNCIERKRLQLATLAEYKKSLIYEYVTGKKEVPQK